MYVKNTPDAIIYHKYRATAAGNFRRQLMYTHAKQLQGEAVASVYAPPHIVSRAASKWREKAAASQMGEARN